MNPSNNSGNGEELRLPVFDEQPRPHTIKMSWEAVTRETEAQRRHYMKHFDSPEKRFRSKNPARFRLD